jgi:hypothetical protein
MRRFVSAVALSVTISSLLAACGGSESSTTVTTAAATVAATTTVLPTTVPSTTAPPTTEALTTDAPVDTTDDVTTDSVVITSFNEFPPECLENTKKQMGEFEKAVGDADVKTMAFSDFIALTDVLSSFDESEDPALSELCDRYDFATDEESQANFIEFANSNGFSKTADYFEVIGQFTIIGAGDPTVRPCPDVTADINGFIAQSPTIAALPVLVAIEATAAVAALQVSCTPEEVATLSADPAFAAFLESMSSLGG